MLDAVSGLAVVAVFDSQAQAEARGHQALRVL